MKIASIKASQPIEQPLIKRIRQSFNNKFKRLHSLMHDVFERNESKYMIIDGKKMRERDIPNSISRPEDCQSAVWGEIEFYPEDIAKMEKMNIDECLQYEKELINKKRFVYSKS